ncbi:S1 family peptidase [Zhihengliuella halotolerans]|uniref:LPXTG-motif cell wall-anchored protein n=1 Tax=Zhihengliuella halotolerans TaxID=370736 RepID=A0A4Q8AII4_9MICC|nr:S1 family peptidase [Zhihengliuella halotolerans]RZU63633.1 LPXTG-motif cell wall-anchored protein [Zhihengliuella halotolerans]
MHASHNFWKRTSVACAATALVFGTAFVAAPAGAAPTAAVPSGNNSGISPELVEISPKSEKSSELPDPEGLEEAVERDLGTSLEEFFAAGEVAKAAAELKAELADQDLTIEVVVEGDRVLALADPDQLDAAKAALKDLTEGVDVDVELRSTEHAVEADAQAEAETTAPEAVPSHSGQQTSDKSAAQKRAVAAGSVESLIAAYTAEFGLANLQSITTDGGRFVIRTGDLEETGPADVADQNSDSAGASAEEFADQYTNVVVEAVSGPAEPFGENDLVGGMPFGQSADGVNWDVCSTGFTGFDAAGNDAVISAGHCSNDGDVVGPLNLLDQQGEPDNFNGPAQVLGSFGFSQFGGAGHSPSTYPEPDNVGTDIAVIDDINPELVPQATVSDWSTAPDITEAGPSVTDVAEPVIGAEVCKSGRTTGWTCGTIEGIGVFFIAGHDYENDENDIRAVQGFSSDDLEASEGDSGGSMISGTVAIGVISGGSDSMTFGTGLVDGLSYTDDYSVRLHLESPEITSVSDGEEVEAGESISGVVADAASGTQVVVRSTGKSPAAYPVKRDGSFAIPAPDEPGTYRFNVQARNGFSTSGVTGHSVLVVEAEPTPTEKPTESAPPSESPSESSKPSENPSESAEPSEKPSESTTPSDSAKPSEKPTTSAPAPKPTQDDDGGGGGRLPDTGASNGMKVAAALGGSMAAAGALLLMLRRPARRH